MSQAQIASITCTLSGLTAFNHTPDQPETILAHDQPFGLTLTVEFSGSGAIALMPLGLPLQVEFFGMAIGARDSIPLGQVTIQTTGGQFTYHPTLKVINGPASLGLVCEAVYRVTGLLRVAASGYPSFLTGVMEDLMIQVY